MLNRRADLVRVGSGPQDAAEVLPHALVAPAETVPIIERGDLGISEGLR